MQYTVRRYSTNFDMEQARGVCEHSIEHEAEINIVTVVNT